MRCYFISLTCFGILFLLLGSSTRSQIDIDGTDAALQIIGLSFEEAEIDSMQKGLKQNLKSYKGLREYKLPNSIPPALNFHPNPIGAVFSDKQLPIDWAIPVNTPLPSDINEVAFYSIPQLASLIKNKKITSVELTQIYLDRLRTYGKKLNCVINLTEGMAIKQAVKADEEIAKGEYKGPLHGIPYGVKDLVSVRGYPTTWGAAPFKNQELDYTATVVQKLEKAGAVLVAKLSMGALAWGDVWFGGKTLNPWNLEQGASGSSAGSASATAAGLVGFSIGTETLGSIVSPSTRCGTTGLRPTYGRVSRDGTMALSWTMDKIGPICRSAAGCAMVFDVIHGPDGKDLTLQDHPFNYSATVDLSKLKVGYLKSAFENATFNQANNQNTLAVFKALGAELIPIELPSSMPIREMRIILSAEAAAAFDELTRTNQDDKMVRQILNAWPNVFRTSRLIPAVAYIQANRIRYQLIQEMHDIMKEVDVLIAPTFGNSQLLTTNFTGHPCVVVPNGLGQKETPTSICLLGNLFDEGTILGVAKAFQDATQFDEKHPEAFQY